MEITDEQFKNYQERLNNGELLYVTPESYSFKYEIERFRIKNNKYQLLSKLHYRNTKKWINISDVYNIISDAYNIFDV